MSPGQSWQSRAVRTPEVITVLVRDGESELWSIGLETIEAHRSYRLTLTSDSGESFAATAWNVFACLLELRQQVEPLHMRLCCNGSRLGTWCSGMQADMGQGLVVYLLTGAISGQRKEIPQLGTLDPAPPDEVVSIAEQRAWYEQWRSRRNETDTSQ
jgi:hypothetical protein